MRPRVFHKKGACAGLLFHADLSGKDALEVFLVDEVFLAVELHPDVDAFAALGAAVAVGVAQRIDAAAVFLW